jgi:hypothetical protein
MAPNGFTTENRAEKVASRISIAANNTEIQEITTIREMDES